MYFDICLALQYLIPLILSVSLLLELKDYIHPFSSAFPPLTIFCTAHILVS